MDSSQIPPKQRTILRSDSFEREANALDPNVPRLDERLRALEWAVATQPQACPVVPGTKFRFLWIAMDQVGALFTIDSPDQCTLWHLLEEPSGELEHVAAGEGE